MLQCKINFAEYRLLSKIMSDAGTNFVPEKFQDFYRQLNINHVVLSSDNQ